MAGREGIDVEEAVLEGVYLVLEVVDGVLEVVGVEGKVVGVIVIGRGIG